MGTHDLVDEAALDDAKKGNKDFVACFGAWDWSGPCRMTKQQLETISTKYPSLYIGLLSTDRIDKSLTEKYNVTAIPTTIYFKAGTEAQRFTGPQSDGMWDDWIKKQL